MSPRTRLEPSWAVAIACFLLLACAAAPDVPDQALYDMKVAGFHFEEVDRQGALSIVDPHDSHGAVAGHALHLMLVFIPRLALARGYSHFAFLGWRDDGMAVVGFTQSAGADLSALVPNGVEKVERIKTLDAEVARLASEGMFPSTKSSHLTRRSRQTGLRPAAERRVPLDPKPWHG